MKHATFLATLVLFVSVGAQAADRAGQCGLVGEHGFNRYVLSVDQSSDGTFLKINNVLATQDGRELSMASEQTLELTNKTVLQDDTKGLKVTTKDAQLVINRETGTGSYSYQEQGVACWPGVNDWCLVKRHVTNRFKFELKDCQVRMPL